MLRNLAPDHTLVLVNGKRRHRSSIIDWHGGNGVAFGSQGPDISGIPAIALRQAEVLRDGAAAQYGSDAIAGVINLQPKNSRSGGSLEFNTGIYGERWDGATYSLAGNAGLPLGATGFANLSFEYGAAEPTDRSIQRSDVAALVAAGNTHVRDPGQIWGSPEVDGDLKLFGNFGYPLTDRLQFYGHTGYASKEVTGGFFFRNPNTRGGVFTADRGRSLLIGDAAAARGEASANCPMVPITDHVPDADAMGRVFADPDCFSFQERFPGGFTPNFGGSVSDGAVVAGIRGFTGKGFVWDGSISVGSHQTDLFISNTVNASLGPDTPTDFDLGSNRQQEISLNLDVSYAVNDRLNLAAGAEWRDEQYETRLGQRESWEVGPYAAQGFSAGSNGFSGYSPQAAGKWNRSNFAAYGDVELSGAEDRWTVGTAARIENFEDFGTTVNGKLSGRYRLAEPFSLRASLSSGFRAPTPGQQNGFNLATVFDPTLGDLVERGTVPSIFPMARLRGGEPLKPETSVNTSAGAVLEKGDVDPHGRLFPHRFGRPDGRDPGLYPHVGRGRSAPGSGGRKRPRTGKLSLLHQRYLHHHPGNRPGLQLRAATAEGRHRVQRRFQPHRHRGDPFQSGTAQRGPAFAGAAGSPAQEPLERQCQPADRPGGCSRAGQLLWRLVRLGQRPDPLQRQAGLRPGSCRAGTRRHEAGIRGAERVQHLS